MWGLKTETVPVVIGALGLVKKRPGKICRTNLCKIEENQCWGPPEDQSTRHSSHFKKSALHKVDNNSPQQLPRKLAASRCSAQKELRNKESNNNNNNDNNNNNNNYNNNNNHNRRLPCWVLQGYWGKCWKCEEEIIPLALGHLSWLA